MFRRVSHIFFKLSVKVRKILETTCQCNLKRRRSGIPKHLAGKFDPKLYNVFHCADADDLLKTVHEVALA